MSSPSTSSLSTTTPSMEPKVVIRCGHIIPSIRLTPPDSRPAMSPATPEQDLGPNSLYVPLRTEEVGWEEGGLIWAPKRYHYPTVNLYGGSDDHVIGSYRGGPKGYRFINITDSAFSVASTEDEGESEKKTKTSKDGSKSAMPKGPATKMQSSSSTAQTTTSTETTSEKAAIEEHASQSASDSSVNVRRRPSSSSSSQASTPSSSRRGSSSTDDGDESSGADTGMTTPTSDMPSMEEKDGELVDRLGAALSALQQQEEDDGEEDDRQSKKTKLASRTGSMEICNETIDASRLAGPLKAQLQNNSLGLDKSLTLSDTIPTSPFSNTRGRSSSRRSNQDNEYAAGWSYEQNMSRDFSQY